MIVSNYYLKSTDMSTKELVKFSLGAVTMLFIAAGCANEGKDSVEKADSINRADYREADSAGGYRADRATSRFLVRAANSGMAEVKMAELASERATRADIKDVAKTIINDHQNANSQVKSLAGQRGIALPDSASDSKRRRYDDLSDERGADFDKQYVNRMIDDHEDDIDMFEDAIEDVRDPEVRNFAQNTLPRLRNHLEMLRQVKDKMR